MSIIVPVFNVSPYLRRCLQSLTEQGLDDYEVLLVNDASHDNSLAICQDWCRDHPQFRLLEHSTNRGLSEARNTGLSEAHGEYVAFADSDDYLAPQTLSQALARMEGADVVEFPVMENHLSERPRLWMPQEGTMRPDEWMDSGGFRHSYVWNKIYKRSLWEGITFPAGKLFEDLRTVPRVLKRAGSIRGIAQGIYYYCVRAEGISRQTDLEHLTHYAEAISLLSEEPQNAANWELYVRALNAQLSYRRAGGRRVFVTARHIPWRFIVRRGLSWRQRLKAVWFKFTYHDRH